jgi:hypothetical protein
VTRLFAARDGQAWSFVLPTSAPGTYTLWVDAEDLAGNVTTAGPFTVQVVCTDATLVVTSLSAEPVAGWPISLTLTAVISNAGPDALPAGIRVAFAEGANLIGLATTTVALASGESQAVQVVWAPGEARQDNLTVTPLGPDAAVPLCSTPPPASFAVSVHDLPLYEDWNLIGLPLRLYNEDVEVVQRGIEGSYAAILGYDGGLQAYYPGQPQDSTLTDIRAGYGYWIRTTTTETIPAELYAEPLTSWRMAGEEMAADQPLPLAPGWNLVGYLPRASLPVTMALQSIDGAYAAVLGFDHTGLSYYPDLSAGSGYNTLPRLTPGAGYWISATHATTLHYALGTSAATLTDTIAYANRVDAIHAAEEAAGVRPTYTWLNLYGTVYLADGSPAPAGSTVTALANGVTCGATVVTRAGRFGLLACYGDDETTPVVDGARAGDAITLLLNGAPVAARPRSFNSQPVAGAQPLHWTGHGDRWELQAGTFHLYMLPIVSAHR